MLKQLSDVAIMQLAMFIVNAQSNHTNMIQEDGYIIDKLAIVIN